MNKQPFYAVLSVTFQHDLFRRGVYILDCTVCACETWKHLDVVQPRLVYTKIIHFASSQTNVDANGIVYSGIISEVGSHSLTGEHLIYMDAVK